MKKKTAKNKKKNQQKTETVHASLSAMKQMILNLEQQIKELNTKVDQLPYFQPYIPYIPKDNKTWPNNPQLPQPYVVWSNHQPQPAMTIKESALKECKNKFDNHNSDIGWDAIDKGLQ